MSKFSTIIAVHHEIIVEADTQEQAEKKAMDLINDTFDAFDTEHVTCDECDEELEETTVDDLHASVIAMKE